MTRPSDERCGRVGHFFGAEALADRPLVITNSSFKHIRKKHMDENCRNPIEAARRLGELFDGLTMKMLDNVLVYQDPGRTNHSVFVLDQMSSTGKHIGSSLDDGGLGDPWAPSAYCLGTDATAQDWESRDDRSWGGDER